MAKIPSYMLIRQYIIDLFFRHAEHDKPLPSEHKLAEKFGVSRPTIRLALDDLVGSGQLLRKNRSGMYLSPDYVTPLAGRYPKILLLVGDGKYAFYSGKMLRIYSRIYDYFSKREYRLVPVNLSTDYSPAEELAFYRPDGILWVQPEPHLAAEVRACAEKFPVQVLFGYDPAMRNNSCIDYAYGAAVLAKYFKKARISAPFLVGAGNSPIRKPFTDQWQKSFGAERILTIRKLGEINLGEFFRRETPEGIFCFGSELFALKAALPRLPRHTVTDTPDAGTAHFLDLTPDAEITSACNSLETLMTPSGRARPCRIIKPQIR